MEQNLAIMIADLSGYTALTETHGPATAANTIDKFIDIAGNCLAGSSKIHQSVGDELMIVADTPDQLLHTAVMLVRNCSNQNYFLQLHGGLHYGKVLKHNEHYFGSPVNLASRIAGMANKGTFWCSSSFISHLEDPSSFLFSAKGKHNFKNVNHGTDVFELLVESENSFSVDPVCRMLLSKNETSIPHPSDPDILFCSAGCHEIYMRNN